MNKPAEKIRSKFIAHRGESYDAPENTMSAIQLAWDRAVEIVEVDVHLTADNEICVIHDKDTLRTTGKNLTVRKSSMEELRKLDAGSWKGKKWAGEKIPTLKETLASVPENGKLVIEIKSDFRILDTLKHDTKNSGLHYDQIEIIAFDLQTLARAKQMMPQYKMFWLFISRPVWLQYLTGTNPGTVIQKLKKYNIDGVNIGNTRFFRKEFIEKFTSEGYPVYTWTVNDLNRALELLKWGVDCVTTDKAAWMAEVLKDH
ncbi:MAG: glycerophosphodiester phosphodiesterase [Bacteroidetes bacterium]|nr:MAG: glycerophosphodiester phosphodiesterase [Bacteroidota bacterium]